MNRTRINHITNIVIRISWWLGLIFLAPGILFFVDPDLISRFFLTFPTKMEEPTVVDLERFLIAAAIGLACWAATMAAKLVKFFHEEDQPVEKEIWVLLLTRVKKLFTLLLSATVLFVNLFAAFMSVLAIGAYEHTRSEDERISRCESVETDSQRECPR